MKFTTRAIVCAALAVTGLQAHALYRCGSVYQDRPCDSSVEQKQLMKSGAVIVTPATPAPKPAAAAVAPPATPAKAAAPAPVAPPPPPAPAKAAVVPTAPATAAAPAAPPAKAPPPAATPSAAPAAAGAMASKSLPAGNSKARCALLGTQLDAVETRARSGGTAADMERFAQERRAVQKSLVDAGC